MVFINKKIITILLFTIITSLTIQLSAGDYDKPISEKDIALVKDYIRDRSGKSPILECAIPAPVQRYQPKSLTHQAAQQMGKYIINLYAQNNSNAHEKTKEYLSELPWEIQLLVFNELLDSLPNDTAWHDKKKAIIVYDPYPEISKTPVQSPLIDNKRQALKKLLLDYLNDETLKEDPYHDRYSDIASIIFNHQEQIFPHSMVLIDILNPEQSKLLTYAPQARLDALAIEIIKNVTKSHDLKNLFPLFIGSNNILRGISLEQRQSLIKLIDSWIQNKSIKVYGSLTKQVIPITVFDSDIDKLQKIKQLIIYAPI